MLAVTPRGVLLNIKVIPKSAVQKICGQERDYLKIKVTAPPDKNLANEAAIALLSDVLHIPKSHIEIIKGLHSRHKVVCFHHEQHAMIEKKLYDLLKEKK